MFRLTALIAKPKSILRHYVCGILCRIVGGIVDGILLSLVVVASAQAGSVQKFSLEEMVDIADKIVVGKCAHVSSRWVGNKIFTDSLIHIETSLKGNSAGEYTVTTLGGTAHHPKLNTMVTMSVSGGLEFRPGEEVVLFTKQNRLGQHQVVGLTQGKFTVETDKASGKRYVPRGLKKLFGETRLQPQSNKGKPPLGPGGGQEIVIKPREITLDEFISEIHKRTNTKTQQK